MILLLVLMYGSSEFLHQLEWDFLLMEEFLNHAVPGLVEGFIHGEHGE